MLKPDHGDYLLASSDSEFLTKQSRSERVLIEEQKLHCHSKAGGLCDRVCVTEFVWENRKTEIALIRTGHIDIRALKANGKMTC